MLGIDQLPDLHRRGIWISLRRRRDDERNLLPRPVVYVLKPSISCKVSASQTFKQYLGGIINEITNDEPNHEVNIIGWGINESGEKIWIGRNSYGT